MLRKPYAFPVEGGKPIQMDLSLGDCEHLRIHPDGKRLASTHEPGNSEDIMVMGHYYQLMKTDQPTAFYLHRVDDGVKGLTRAHHLCGDLLIGKIVSTDIH